jgi:pantothenate kinase
MSPREIFEAYKERWKIETFYDYVKHELEFETLYQQDHCRTQGLAFVVQIAGMVHAEASASLAGTGVTFSEAVEILSDVMLAREGSGLRLRNVTKEVRALCQKIGLSLSHGVERVVEIERQAGLAG